MWNLNFVNIRPWIGECRLILSKHVLCIIPNKSQLCPRTAGWPKCIIDLAATNTPCHTRPVLNSRDLLYRAAHFLTSSWKLQPSARSFLDWGHCVEVAPALACDGNLLPDVGQVLQIWEQDRNGEVYRASHARDVAYILNQRLTNISVNDRLICSRLWDDFSPGNTHWWQSNAGNLQKSNCKNKDELGWMQCFICTRGWQLCCGPRRRMRRLHPWQVTLWPRILGCPAPCVGHKDVWLLCIVHSRLPWSPVHWWCPLWHHKGQCVIRQQAQEVKDRLFSLIGRLRNRTETYTEVS